MTKNKAIFLDRDGVINDLVYYSDEGILDSPNSVEQFTLLPKVIDSLKILRKLGFLLILISNQPGIAKEKYTHDEFERIKKKMEFELNSSDIYLNDQFYCFHHPNSKLKDYKLKCKCRKPNTKLVLDAVKKHQIDLTKSYIIGDGFVDLQLAKNLDCSSILIGNLSSTLSKQLSEKKLSPVWIAHDLFEAATFLK